MTDTSIVSIALGARSYDIHIGDGLLEKSGELILPMLARPSVIIVTDENVMAAQGRRLEAGLIAAGVAANFIVLPPGERTKSFQQLSSLCEKLLDLGVERSDLVIALGGGVIGDLTGFAASMIKRGCRFAQAPTSLLAQVDSAVGGKTAINTPQGKNLIGAFYQPSLVLCDTACLKTLNERERRAGYAEIVKYALIDDAPFFDWLETRANSIIDVSSPENVVAAVRKACEKKAAIVAEDETEHGKRALLNLGHTFGHALEAECGYDQRLLHGEAVAIGLALAFEYSASVGLCRQAIVRRVKTHLQHCGLPCSIGDIEGANKFTAQSLLEKILQDKKAQSNRLTFILARDIGEAFIAPGDPPERVLEFLEGKLAELKKVKT